MASLCLSTARALVKPTSASHVAKCASSAVQCEAKSAVFPAFASGIFSRHHTAPRRGLVGIAGAPASFAAGARSIGSAEKRAAFHVSAVAGGDPEAAGAAEDTSGGAGAGNPVKLYIGNLPWSVDDAALAEVFTGYECVEITVVSDANTGRSRGFGFVSVANQEEADKAIEALDGAEIEGRPIRVSVSVARGGDRGERPPREPKNFDYDSRKVYFGNLSWGMDHLDLNDLCAEFGSVEDARLITDRETGRSRGFGFVTMSSEEEANAVVQGLNGQDVDGRVLRVNIANTER